jgi:hypothetical protein
MPKYYVLYRAKEDYQIGEVEYPHEIRTGDLIRLNDDLFMKIKDLPGADPRYGAFHAVVLHYLGTNLMPTLIISHDKASLETIR